MSGIDGGVLSRRQAWYVVILCMLAFVLSYTDRQVLSLLVEPIKADLKISDTQFGLLQGLAFSLFYAILGIPISGMSDGRSRPLIIAAGVLFWSAATMCCGLARSYFTLLVSRMGVGVGEATLSPATYSIISDMFPPEELGRPTAVYSLGSFLGAGVAFIVGGAVIAAFSNVGPTRLAGIVFQPWQMVFLVAGAPGIVLAAVVGLTVRDPGHAFAGRRPLPPRWREVGQFLARHRVVFISHMLGYSLYSACLFSLLSWSPAYLMRVHGLAPQQAGLLLGSIAILCNGSGVLVSGFLVDRRRRSGRLDGPLLIGAIGALAVTVPLALLPFLTALTPCLAALALAMFFTSFPMPPSVTLIQELAPPAMRSRISAIFLFCNSMLGLGGGAALVGLLNDHVFPGPDGVAKSLALTAGVSALLGAFVLARGIPALTRALGPQGQPR